MKRALALALLLTLGADARAQDLARATLLDAHNRALDPARHALAPSLRLPNDATLPRAFAWSGTSDDPRDVRVEVAGDAPSALLESVDALGTVRHAIELPLRAENGTARSAFVRLVTTQLDVDAPDARGRVLRVAVGDRVRVSAGDATSELPVGRPGSEDGPLAIRRARLRVRVVRSERAGVPPLGSDDPGALAALRGQVATANEIWAQCLVHFGDPAELDIAVVDPPVASLLAIADVDGLPAAGGGVISLTVDGRALRPIPTRRGARPVETALAIAAAVRGLGYVARVFENERTENGADRSADVVAHRRDGTAIRWSSNDSAPLSTDARQRIEIAEVDLGDGVREFDNMTALTGTLEERALVRGLADEDEGTIDVLVVSAFTGGTRDGEAFVHGEAAGAPGAIADVVVLSREGVARGPVALTLAHELGHVLLDQPLHPDHLGGDRPWLLMDSDAIDGTIHGPRRLTEAECERARARSGPGARRVLLAR